MKATALLIFDNPRKMGEEENLAVLWLEWQGLLN